MIIWMLSACLLAAGPASQPAEEGVMVPVAVEGKGDFFGFDFKKAPADAGTVHPMALVGRSAEGLAFAVDARTRDAKRLDVIRIDFTGQGDFKSAAVVSLEPGPDSHSSWRVGPTQIQYGRDDWAIPLLATGYCNRANTEDPALTVYLGTAMEGCCRFGEQVRRVRLVDRTGDFNCGDPAVRRDGRFISNDGDLLVVAGPDGDLDKPAATSSVGMNLYLDSKFYRVEVSQGGRRIAALPLEVETGQVRVPHKCWRGVLVSDENMFKLEGGDQPITLPVGKYNFEEYTELSPLRPDAKLLCFSLFSPQVTQRELHPAEILELPVGSPVTMFARVQVLYGTVYFQLKATDPMGHEARIEYVESRRQPRGKVEVLNSAGDVVHSGALVSDGPEAHGKWQPSPQLKGEFTAHLVLPEEPFPAITKDVTFSLPGGQ